MIYITNHKVLCLNFACNAGIVRSCMLPFPNSIHTYTRAQAHTQTHVHARMHTHAHAHAQTHAHDYIYAHIV